MSKQLRLNALHFAKGLEDEKGLLESAAETLESKFIEVARWMKNGTLTGNGYWLLARIKENLSRTQSSKTKLSTVTKKTRGTTCLTFMTIVIVFVVWMWTYLIIRMT